MKYSSKIKQGKFSQQCLECGLWFNKLCSHTWQAHALKAYDYKKKHGLETTKSLVSDEYKAHKRHLVLTQQQDIIKENLIERGKNTRLKKGHHFNYQRTPATIKALKERFKEFHEKQRQKKKN